MQNNVKEEKVCSNSSETPLISEKLKRKVVEEEKNHAFIDIKDHAPMTAEGLSESKNKDKSRLQWISADGKYYYASSKDRQTLTCSILFDRKISVLSEGLSRKIELFAAEEVLGADVSADGQRLTATSSFYVLTAAVSFGRMGCSRMARHQS